MEREFFRDLVGNEVRVGDYIAYGTLYGRSAGLKLGRVEAIKVKGERWNGENWSITVTGCEEEYWKKETPKPWVKNRKGTLMYPDRTIRINDWKIPQQMKDLFAC